MGPREEVWPRVCEAIRSSVSVATSDNNGTFIDTLRMTVYNDTNYSYKLLVPVAGLELKTKVYVEVEAVNLTGNCAVNQKASITTNGVGKYARFNFEAFRFVEHRDQEKSTIYLHCVLRLCEPTKSGESPAADGNMTGVVLGAVFGSVAVTLLTLAGWVAIKKFCFSRGGL
ncbi:hypothetical protein CRUP_028048, partial [Coryphaenoides rupestris]